MIKLLPAPMKEGADIDISTLRLDEILQAGQITGDVHKAINTQPVWSGVPEPYSILSENVKNALDAITPTDEVNDYYETLEQEDPQYNGKAVEARRILKTHEKAAKGGKHTSKKAEQSPSKESASSSTEVMAPEQAAEVRRLTASLEEQQQLIQKLSSDKVKLTSENLTLQKAVELGRQEITTLHQRNDSNEKQIQDLTQAVLTLKTSNEQQKAITENLQQSMRAEAEAREKDMMSKFQAMLAEREPAQA